nr:hypothetical protein [Bacteroidota bacterium]
MRKRGIEKEVAYKDHTIAKENLPLPVVHYPGNYGAFFGFAEFKNTPLYLCSCSKIAIENYTKFRLRDGIPLNAYPSRNFILDSMYFPASLVDELMQINAPKNEKIMQHLRFKNKLCHECNKVVPSFRYCVEMYGGVFKQNYGWYINKQAYEMGIKPISNRILSDICPKEILDLIEDAPTKTPQIYRELSQIDFDKANELWKKYQKQIRKIWKIIENEVRLKFNHKKIGEAWTSETILYHIITSLFPTFTIHRHYRPQFLEGMEFDIFIENLNLGIEYQGIQHYEPVSYWGGKEAFGKLQKRDVRKKKLANSNKVNLAYFKYNEDLSDSIVIEKLKDYINTR